MYYVTMDLYSVVLFSYIGWFTAFNDANTDDYYYYYYSPVTYKSQLKYPMT